MPTIFWQTNRLAPKNCKFAVVENIGVYISELLTEHDCVIVPDFGGFVARPSSAHFAKGGSMLMPPGKSLVFNHKLDNSDGLLAHHISRAKEITYRAASELLEQWVISAKRQLESQKRLELEQTGILYYNAENNLLFEPSSRSNHEVSSFGLPAVHAELTGIPVPQVQEEKQYRALTVPIQKNRTLIRATVFASSVILLFVLVILAAQNAPVQRALASLNPFAKKESSYVMHSYNMGELFWSGKAKASTAIAGTKLSVPEISSRTFFIAPDTVNTDKTRVHKITDFSGTNNYNAPFQIVVGCFAVESNADKLIRQLQHEGVVAGISGQNAKGLYVVSIAGFTTESMARTKLQQVKQRFPAAWILVK